MSRIFYNNNKLQLDICDDGKSEHAAALVSSGQPGHDGYSFSTHRGSKSLKAMGQHAHLKLPPPLCSHTIMLSPLTNVATCCFTSFLEKGCVSEHDHRQHTGSCLPSVTSYISLSLLFLCPTPSFLKRRFPCCLVLYSSSTGKT